MFGLHYDPEYYPNPTKYDPDRFSDENTKTFPNYAYLPFGSGPHNCIGKELYVIGVVGMVSGEKELTLLKINSREIRTRNF